MRVNGRFAASGQSGRRPIPTQAKVAERGTPFLYLGLPTRLHYAFGPSGLVPYGFYTLCHYCVPALVQSIKNKLPGEAAMETQSEPNARLFARPET